MYDLSIPARLERIAELLQRHQVQFIVIGGQAEYIFGIKRIREETGLK